MTGVTPTAGAASPCESGPGASILPSTNFPLSVIAGLVSPTIAQACGRAAGIALRLRTGPDGAESFQIAVVDECGRPLFPLGPIREEEVIAVWRGLGANSGLPLMMERADGTLDTPYPQVGRVQLGAIRIRRRHGLLSARRPRFLTRRKTGRLPVRPAIHREREITTGA